MIEIWLNINLKWRLKPYKTKSGFQEDLDWPKIGLQLAERLAATSNVESTMQEYTLASRVVHVNWFQQVVG